MLKMLLSFELSHCPRILGNSFEALVSRSAVSAHVRSTRGIFRALPTLAICLQDHKSRPVSRDAWVRHHSLCGVKGHRLSVLLEDRQHDLRHTVAIRQKLHDKSRAGGEREFAGGEVRKGTRQTLPTPYPNSEGSLVRKYEHNCMFAKTVRYSIASAAVPV